MAGIAFGLFMTLVLIDWLSSDWRWLRDLPLIVLSFCIWGGSAAFWGLAMWCVIGG